MEDATLGRTRTEAAQRATGWTAALLGGAVVGVALLLLHGQKFPGHRSFFYLLTLVSARKAIPQQPCWALGLTTGLVHMLGRALVYEQSFSLDLIKLLVTPLLVLAVWEWATTIPWGQQHTWLKTLAAGALATLIVPLVSTCADFCLDGFVITPHLLRIRPWMNHLGMGLLGALLGTGCGNLIRHLGLGNRSTDSIE